MAIFLLASCHRKKMGPPEVLAHSEFIGVCQIRSTRNCFDCISLVGTQNHVSFVLLDSLFSKEFSVKNSNFFQQFEPVFTLIRESRFNSFCWAVPVLENNDLFRLVLTHPR